MAFTALSSYRPGVDVTFLLPWFKMVFILSVAHSFSPPPAHFSFYSMLMSKVLMQVGGRNNRFE